MSLHGLRRRTLPLPADADQVALLLETSLPAVFVKQTLHGMDEEI
ncbi:hypothetical protein ACIP25_02835 [Streptomyces massasporeus]